MARPLRIEFPDALYHITSRGNARADIYSDDVDRCQFLDLLDEASKRWQADFLHLRNNKSDFTFSDFRL